MPLNTFPWIDKQRDSSVVGAGAEVTFLGKLDEVTLFLLCWNFFFFHILLKSGCSTCISTLVSHVYLEHFCRMLSGPADLPIFNCLMALLISSFVGEQHWICRLPVGSQQKDC
ncbi:hypothetical protein DPMN_150304 [Dreissena polymorpha]|uniref:Uncharacterized protein n=1 Tax=Dreissena polymorpha TaxID=45954 RepID=A0A9D4FD43_DREPO|nr:hypothetical protein DPMN_150304 [Dreissena polymorpha]